MTQEANNDDSIPMDKNNRAILERQLREEAAKRKAAEEARKARRNELGITT